MFAKVMMADLSLSQNKPTMRTHTHSLSGEADEVIGGCETCFILITRLERLLEHCYTINVCGRTHLMIALRLRVDVVKTDKIIIALCVQTTCII